MFLLPSLLRTRRPAQRDLRPIAHVLCGDEISLFFPSLPAGSLRRLPHPSVAPAPERLNYAPAQSEVCVKQSADYLDGISVLWLATQSHTPLRLTQVSV